SARRTNARRTATGTVRAAASAGASADRWRPDLSIRSGRRRDRERAFRHRTHRGHVRGYHRMGHAITPAVSRDEQRLAGKRSGARRDHERFRIAGAGVAFGGRGEFDGEMSGAFRAPRVQGTFRGDDLRAWDTTWGSATGR